MRMRNPFWRIYEDQEMYKLKPWWLGVAYRKWDRHEDLYVLVPFNKLVGWMRVFWFWLHQPSQMAQAQAQWKRGFEHGKKVGREDFIREATAEREHGRHLGLIIACINKAREERGEYKL